MSKLKAVILAAGAGTRMKSELPKVVHKILGKTMLDYVIESAINAGADDICVVIGHEADTVKKAVSYDVEFVLQEDQLGTGHAVMQAKEFIGNEGNVLILFGDTPLISEDTLLKMVDYHIRHDNAATLLSTIVEDPTGYGRIIRDETHTFIKSVEHKDATESEKMICEINSGMYCFDAKALNEALKTLSNDNAQGEYYLPDTLKSIMAKRLNVNAMISDRYEDILGVNSKVQLYQAGTIMQKRINFQHMENGVTIMNPSHTYISKDATIGADTTIYPNNHIEGKTTIGKNCIIGPNCRIVDSHIGEYVNVDGSTILDSQIGNYTTVGPFAYIRPGSIIGHHAKIGDFVEIKNATMGDYTKASHLTYVGDADVGNHVNFGCGSVVVNYDGEKKHRTTIEDNAFIGCNTNLVSPVKVEESAYTAAGSTITKNVPSYALGIGRARQVNMEEWVKRNR
ncbi:bifunctional UDP-N-acetylglucosamine diphosphorylase/glucosamine-1-phosphate N-acetyltransferase GlmU [Vallitalea pronyensis]|uniref:Bifunctional protein GlmU n=1 Tax=Vallitalea pronyensis TaxID=1348613 RepID=A0A8J8SEX4_9FIRM|nr:bifunctional UDP-N-acetylglucosamine diphosphorylase/glucosamine-1-phosphate N-acetyltransferase GlmU [Vallitalea pronyensis]QUI20832.1 bifunctional UDP-N-acetylglucosamine diphosphorylase/glucosamine-1-phosphate N-acetyltransferase GlmU [Vallitalea pronyensis]